jgi:hypothetical protein
VIAEHSAVNSDSRESDLGGPGKRRAFHDAIGEMEIVAAFRLRDLTTLDSPVSAVTVIFDTLHPKLHFLPASVSTGQDLQTAHGGAVADKVVDLF